jgi:hypothetical protein
VFVNRLHELAAWNGGGRSPVRNSALVRRRRRVGKTALVRRFADGRPTVFHVGARRPAGAEVAQLIDQTRFVQMSCRSSLPSRSSATPM